MDYITYSCELGRLESSDLNVINRKLVFIGNMCRVLGNCDIDMTYIMAFVKRCSYEIFYNEVIQECHAEFIGNIFADTYLYDFLSDNVGYCLTVHDKYSPSFRMNNNTLKLNKTIVDNVSDAHRNIILKLSKLKGYKCYELLLNVIDGKVQLDADEFLDFKVRKLPKGYEHDRPLKDFDLKYRSQLDVIRPMLRRALIEYNKCSTPLELIEWFEIYIGLYNGYINDDIPDSITMANTFYIMEGNTIPNHDNIL